MICNVDKLINKYPTLHYTRSPPNCNFDVIEGNFIVNATPVDLSSTMLLDFSIYAEMYFDENIAPIIKETSGKVNSTFPHVNPNGTLCLAVETEILTECTTSQGFDVLMWFDKFVLPFFYSFEDYKANKLYPFGERRHGAVGILEFYQEIFRENDAQKALALLKYIAYGRYRGHLSCPCGSGKRIRKCHSKAIWNAQVTLSKVRMLRDYNLIVHEKENYYE